MEFIITFFRDILDGPVYIVVTVICSILICACIGYLAEKRQKKKQESEQYVEISKEPVAVTSTMPNVVPVEAAPPISPQVMQTPTSSSGAAPAVSLPSVSNGTISPSGNTISQIPTTTEEAIPAGPVQIDKPQVVAIPVSDTEASQLSRPQEILPTSSSSPNAIPSMQVAPTAPSVPTVAVAGQSSTSTVPTSVNK